MSQRIFVTIVLALLLGMAWAETPEAIEDFEKLQLKFQLGDKSQNYSKLSFATQFWSRYTQLNAGTTAAAGQALDAEADFALRRTRFSMYNSFDDRVVLYTQLGFNNLNATSPRPNLYFHDAWGMFRLISKKLYVGAGLNGWNGISRLSNVSYQGTITLDNPGFNAPNINHTDLATRQLGFFIKGTSHHFSYRAAISKPFVYDNVAAIPSIAVAYEYPSDKFAYKAYLSYHFFDEEYFNVPYLKMTYLGEKKICNLGIGYDYHAQSLIEFKADGSTQLQDRKLGALDLFIEWPWTNKQAFTLYAVYYNYDLGKNYLRKSGTMNIWNGGTAIEGGGNSEFKIGTGSIYYTTLGYILPQDFANLPGRLQLFYAYSLKQFEAISTNLPNTDAGINYYLAGQKLKFSFQYSSRPVLNATMDKVTDHLGSYIFQMQIAI